MRPAVRRVYKSTDAASTVEFLTELLRELESEPRRVPDVVICALRRELERAEAASRAGGPAGVAGPDGPGCNGSRATEPRE